MTGKRSNGWVEGISRLIRRASSDLPRDVESALQSARRRERKGSPAQWTLDAILENVRLAREREAPLCQDTGWLHFYVRAPAGFDAGRAGDAIRTAVDGATKSGLLRQNTIDPLSGAPQAANTGVGAPAIDVEYGRGRSVEIRLMMKGAGSENVSAQYSLPEPALRAGRDMDGVRRCALDAVWRAQGMGCAPGSLGICIGGDRAAGAAFAKKQLLRTLGDRGGITQLARLEARILKDANASGIGPMGLGGRTTLLGVKAGALSRLPGSYFVSVSYMCWAFRRCGAAMSASDGTILRWLNR